MSKLRKAVLFTPLLFATSILPATAQNHRNDSAYYNGMRNGGRGGSYYNNRDPRYNNNYNNNNYNNNYYHDDHRQGGIGPGKGALIGGAAGAGIGAVVGEAAQNKRNNDHYRRPY